MSSGIVSSSSEPEPGTGLQVQPEILTVASRIEDQLCKKSHGFSENASRTDLVSYSIFSSVDGHDRDRFMRMVREDPEISRSMASMVGMAVADSIGHMFEFLPVGEPGHYFDAETLEVTGELNKFLLKPGQWTDDTSQALCMADSLLVCHGYNGTDIRVRFWNWWFRGYNNAFRLDASRDGSRGSRGSVGVGGNTRHSLDAIGDDFPAPRFGKGEDAGNGSLMRLAPIPIFFLCDLEAAIRVSQESSYTTHPGPIAADACGFLGFLLFRAITCSSSETAKQFLDRCVEEYLARPEVEWQPLLSRLLRSEEPEGGKERCWNWRSPSGPFLLETLASRGSQYNGHPVSAGYFGSYSMDALAIALHCFYHTNSFLEAVAKCVIFLGDADTTGAICGQIAGSFYGMQAIDERLVTRLLNWDGGEVALRAALLAVLGRSGSVRGLDRWMLPTKSSEDIPTPEQIAAQRFKQEGNWHYKERRLQEALDMYERAIKNDPNELTYHSNCCAVWIEMGEEHYDKVIAECEKLLDRLIDIRKAKPSGASSEKVAKLLNRMASVLHRRQNLHSALEVYSKSLTEDNKNETRNVMKEIRRIQMADNVTRSSASDSKKSQEEGSMLACTQDAQQPAEPAHQNFYELLKLSQDATDEDIRRELKRQCVKYHPDRGGDRHYFEEVVLAYKTLSDKALRKAYDVKGWEGVEEVKKQEQKPI